MIPIKLPRGVINTQIIKHYTENFNPQEIELDFECEFNYQVGRYNLTFEVPYSTSLIKIYSDDEICVKCGAIDVELILTPDLSQDPKAMPLHLKLRAIEDRLTEDYDKECYELRQDK